MSDESEAPDWFALIAKERGMSEGWAWFHSEWRGEGEHAVMLVKGGIAGHVYTRGPKKGKPNPAKRTNVCELVISRADLSAIKAKWQLETGRCSECYGAGVRNIGWSKEHGMKTKPCKQCDGTGAPARLAEGGKP